MKTKVKEVLCFPNGIFAVVDYNGKQISKLQGIDSIELRKKIGKAIDSDTVLTGITLERLKL